VTDDYRAGAHVRDSRENPSVTNEEVVISVCGVSR